MDRLVFLSLVLSMTLAADALAQGCPALLQHGLHNVSVQYGPDVALATRYFAHCTDSSGTAQVPEASWCSDAARRQAEPLLAAYRTAYPLYASAVEAWEQCRAYRASGLQLTPQITPDARRADLGLRYTFSPDTTQFLGVTSDHFRCVIIMPTEHGIRERRPDRDKTITDVHKALRAGQAVTVRCDRAASRTRPSFLASLLSSADSTSYQVLERGDVTLLTSAGSMHLFFAEEVIPPVQVEQALATRLANVETWVSQAPSPPDDKTLPERVASLDSSVASLNEGMASLTRNVTSLNAGMASLNASSADLNTNVEQLFERVALLEDSLKTLAVLRQQIATLSDTLDARGVTLRQVEKDLASYITRLETTETQAQKATRHLKRWKAGALGLLSVAAGVVVGVLIGGGGGGSSNGGDGGSGS